MMAVSLRIQPCLSTGLVSPLGHHTDSASTPHQQMTRQDARACLVSGLRLLRTVDGWPSREVPLQGAVCWILPPPHLVTSCWQLEI